MQLTFGTNRLIFGVNQRVCGGAIVPVLGSPGGGGGNGFILIVPM
jgi:hypothetical protein